MDPKSISLSHKLTKPTFTCLKSKLSQLHNSDHPLNHTTKMGRRTTKSHTLPSSPTHSSSSSDFEFTISISPRKSTATLCPADELFYKGQLLPLHLSPRLSMVRTLLSSSSTSSSSDTTTTASRDSTASHSSSDCDSSRPSSATDDEFKRLTTTTTPLITNKKTNKYFSLSKFSSVFKKENKNPPPSSKSVSSTAKEVIRKYLKKVKPFYEKLSQKQQKGGCNNTSRSTNTTFCVAKGKDLDFVTKEEGSSSKGNVSLSFSGNLRYPMRKRSCVSSCPSSMRSSPSHSKSGFGFTQMNRVGSGSYLDSSSMEELQSAIQGAIAHCKNSMVVQNKIMVSNEI